jgi:hypothetical protein
MLCLAQCMLLSLCALAEEATIISFDPPGLARPFLLASMPAARLRDTTMRKPHSRLFRTPDGSFTAAIDGAGATVTYA